MQHLGSAATAALLALAASAHAYDFGNGLSIVGEVELQHLSDGTDSKSFLAGDVTLAWRYAGDSGLGFGFDLTVDSLYQVSGDQDFTAYWGGLVLTTSLGEITIGAAHPVIETVYRFPKLGTSKLADLQLLSVGGPLVSFLTLINDDVTPGLSLAGATGALSHGVSLHELDTPGGDVRSSQIALGYDMANTRFLGGFEVIGLSGGNSISIYKLAVLHQMDALTLGAEISAAEGSLTGTESFGCVHAAYDVTEALTVSANYGQVDGPGTSDELWSLSAEYRFGNGGFVQAGSTNLGEDDFWDVGIGFRF